MSWSYPQLSTGHRDAAAAGGEAGWSCPSTAVPRVSFCKCRACTRSKENFSQAILLGSFQTCSGFLVKKKSQLDSACSVKEDQEPSAALGSGSSWPPTLPEKPPQFHHKMPNPLSSFQKNQCGGMINGVKAEAYVGMQAELCNHSIFLCSDRVKLQKQFKRIRYF